MFKNPPLSYCSNVACYLMFKTRRTPLRFHPVTARLVQYKQLLDEMAASPVDSAVMEQGRRDSMQFFNTVIIGYCDYLGTRPKNSQRQIIFTGQ